MNPGVSVRSLRFAGAGIKSARRESEGKTVTVACLMAAGSITSTHAQEASSPLPPVTVDAPVTRPKPVASKPTLAHLRARARDAIRRRARQAPQPQHPTRPAASLAPSNLPILAREPGSDPYANPAAPYMAQTLSSQKFSEPIVNTPKSVTVLTQDVLRDKNATSFREVARTTPGVTLGTGEGGSAFGDRFFIRGFDARYDVFVVGIRDPAVSIRENFFTEQLELLKGPSATVGGRGTTRRRFEHRHQAGRGYRLLQGRVGTVSGTDNTKRVTLDVNKAISDGVDVRLDAMAQGANIAGRNYTFDNRDGIAGAITLKPASNVKVTANYYHVDLNSLPDFGVPYDSGRETAVHLARRAARYLLRLRQSRFPARHPGHRNGDGRGECQRLRHLGQ